MDEAEYVSFDLFLQSNFRLSELGFDPRTCLNAHSFALFVFIPFLFLPAYFPLHALMSGWASSKDIHYRNTELIPPLSLFAFPLVSLLLSFFFSLFTLLSKISHSRAQGRGSLRSDGSHFCPAAEKSGSFVQTHRIIFPESHEESQRSHE